MSELGLQPRSHFEIGNVFTGERTTLPCFTCVHCNRVVVMNPERTRPRNVCRKCMALTCDSAGCAAGCEPLARDAERAFVDLDGQPWLLRHHGEPLARIVDAHGDEALVLRKDNGKTLRQMRREERRGR